MGQIDEELNAAATAPPEESAAGADDLLAQLAGDEIDKMLAEADVETTPPASHAAPISAPEKDFAPPEATLEVSQSDVDALLKEAGVEVVPSEPPASSPAHAAEAEKTSEPIASQPGLLVEAAKVAEEPAHPAPREPAPAPAATEAALVETPAAPVAEPAAETDEASPKPVEDPNATLPFYVRFLELLNLPFESLSDTVRDLMGGVALVTLFNSVVLIGYVMLFRHK